MLNRKNKIKNNQKEIKSIVLDEYLDHPEFPPFPGIFLVPLSPMLLRIRAIPFPSLYLFCVFFENVFRWTFLFKGAEPSTLL